MINSLIKRLCESRSYWNLQGHLTIEVDKLGSTLRVALRATYDIDKKRACW